MTESLRDRVVAALGHQYQIHDEIGRGGMSVVYRARDLRLNRMVAVKVLPPELAHDLAVGRRFTREAQTAAQLAHPHIVPIHDVGEHEGIAYLVMALVTGGNLAARLEQQPMRPIDEVRRILAEVADALAYAHLRGVIHRDVKADNILIDGESERAVVTDFGIARAMEGGSRLTLTGIAVGTPMYMSPEQAVGERDLDGRSDVYSLGVLGYQMLTGRLPFTASNAMAMLLKHVSERPRPIAELRPEAPRALCAAVERAMMKAPADRWPTAAAMRDAILGGESQSTPWRGENREPVRYVSPVPASTRGDGRSAVVRRNESAPERGAVPRSALESGAIQLEPPHLAMLTPEQREDLRLWGGHVNLVDRIKEARRYAVYTLGMFGLGIAGFAVGISDVPPFVLSPIVPLMMSVKLWRRGKSLRAAGLRLRRVFLMPRAKYVLPSTPVASQRQLEKVAPREILEGPHGAVVRRAVEDRAAILDIVGRLSKADRAALPEIEPTVDGLVDRVAHLATTLHRLEKDFEPGFAASLVNRSIRASDDSAEEQRRLGLLQRQRESADELARQRTMLIRQLENSGLALSNLRLDLIKLRAGGLGASAGDLSNATAAARALSRDISLALEAANEVRSL